MRKMLPEKGAEGREKQKISTRNREQILKTDKACQYGDYELPAASAAGS